MGLSACPFSRYSRCRPSSRTSTAPTSRSTRRCLDTCGWASPSRRTRSFTGRSPPTRRSRICRRRGSATALNASAVVAALATAPIIYPYGNMSTRADRRARAGGERSLPRAWLARRHELVEHGAQPGEIGELSRRRRLSLLPETVDPDRADAELACGSDVVEVALGHVDVARPIGVRPLVEGSPVAVRRLVRADLRGDDRAVEQDADPAQRGFDQVAIGVREGDEL